MPHYILDKPYKTTAAEGIGASLVVVHGALTGECALPLVENAGSILGVTVDPQHQQNQRVSIRKAGIALVVAAGPIGHGDPVNVAGNSGKVQTITVDASGKANCLGFAETAAVADGDIINVFISLHERAVPTS
jgi:hypothetical protein